MTLFISEREFHVYHLVWFGFGFAFVSLFNRDVSCTQKGEKFLHCL